MGTITDKANEENDERLKKQLSAKTMKIEKLREEIEQYLQEQDISFKPNETLDMLCFKAALNGYSFSDEMYEPETRPYLPTSKEALLIDEIVKLKGA